jgi:pimeloyl-ACP methyl ester carboxylesterase
MRSDLGRNERQLLLDTPTGALAGTLTVPTTETEHVGLIISGSGPTDRDGNSAALPGRNDSLRLLADGLASTGVATLRADKRGVGESVATPEQDLRLETYVHDALAWLDHLKGEAGFRRFSIIGHSEGSLVGMLVADSFPAEAFISLEGAGRTAQETLIRQLRPQLSETQMNDVEEVVDRLAAAETMDPLPEQIAAVPTLASMFRSEVQPYLISWFTYDPADVLARLEIPILIVQGTSDLQVERTDAERLVAANHRSRLAEIDDMNHVLKTAPSDPRANLATYSNPDLPLAPSLVPAITRFLTKVGLMPATASDQLEKGPRSW